MEKSCGTCLRSQKGFFCPEYCDTCDGPLTWSKWAPYVHEDVCEICAKARGLKSPERKET